jgi:hypothetical protein
LEKAALFDDIKDRICGQANHLKYYIGHLMRSHHESKVRSEVMELMAEVEVLLTADFKMKFLSTMFMERQQEFFEKAGMTLSGTI